jgi:hypothetical protein
MRRDGSPAMGGESVMFCGSNAGGNRPFPGTLKAYGEGCDWLRGLVVTGPFQKRCSVP